MRLSLMSSVVELFGHSPNLGAEGLTNEPSVNWTDIVTQQRCPFYGRKCYKTRKSDPATSIGTCVVNYGTHPIVICPSRFIERRQIFVDCLHLLSNHEPGNELHIVHEISIPGGSVDYFIVSARDGRVKDFVGIEIQTLDTTGTVWPERQRLLKELGVARNDDAENSTKPFGMNWKMTSKTILVQMHHKVRTFEHINKKIVLVVQDKLLAYMSREFNFAHLHKPALTGDSAQFHAYSLASQTNGSFRIQLADRLSTDSEGIAQCLGLQTEARVELDVIIRNLERKISTATRFTPV